MYPFACVPVVDLFRSCDLDLDPMTFIYEFDPYCLKIGSLSTVIA